MKYFLNIVFLVSFLPVFSQVITFANVYGGSNVENGSDIEQTLDGGYIITGATGSFGYGQSDMYLLKLDTAGAIEWSKSYGGNNIDWGYDVLQTADKGYIIAGYTNSFGAGGYDFYVVKTDSIGDTLWTNTYGGADWDFAYSITQTSDLGYMIVGETYSFGAGKKDGYYIKISELGELIWQKYLGGTEDDAFKSILKSFDDEYYICGETASFTNGKKDGWIVKTNNSGAVIWSKNYGGVENEGFNDIAQFIDTSAFAINGYTESQGAGGKDMYLFEIDNDGVFLFDKVFGGAGDEIGESVAIQSNGEIAILATIDLFEGDFENHKLSPSNGYLGGGTKGGLGKEKASKIKATSDNGFIMIGTSEGIGEFYSDVLVFKTNKDLDAFNSGVYGQIVDTNSIYNPIVITKLDNQFKNRVSIYPNPTSSSFRIQNFNYPINSLELYNLIGEKIEFTMVISENIIEVNRLNSTPSGIYFLHFNHGKNINIIQKIIYTQN